jgi:hypothetical protein
MSNPQITVTTTPPNQVQVLDGSIAVSIPASVSSLNGLIGNVSLSGNTGVVVQSVANTISIGITNVVSSINNLRGVVGLFGDSNINIQTSGNTVAFGLTNVARTNVSQSFSQPQEFSNGISTKGITLTEGSGLRFSNYVIRATGSNIIIGSTTNVSSPSISNLNNVISLGDTNLTKTIQGTNIVGIGRRALENLNSGTNVVAIGTLAGTCSSTRLEVTDVNNGIFIGNSTKPLNTTSFNEIIIGTAIEGLGNNTTVIGNNSTTKTKLQGLLELDDGVASLNVKNKIIRIEQPQTIVDPFVEGSPGVMCWDDNNLYIKTNQGWKQLALTPVTGNLTGITFDFRLLPADFTNYLTFLRGSSASYLNDAGLTYVQQDIPRIAYYLNSNGNIEDLAGLLVEGSSSNLLPSLETFYDSGSFWQSTSPSSLDVITGSCNGTDLFGENNVLRLTPIGSGNIQHYISSNPGLFPPPLGTIGQSSTISIWAKNYSLEEPLYLAIQMVDQACTITCDLAENRFDIDSRFAAIPRPVGKITSYPDDWKKITFTYTNKESVNNSIRIYVTNNFTNYNVGFTAAGYEGTGILVADIQLENQTTDSSYIKTVGSSVTRSPDRLFMDGVSFSSWFSATSGTFVALVDNSLQDNTIHTQGNVRTLFSINYAPGSTNGFAVERVMGMCGYRFISHNNGISYNFGSNINLNTVKNSIIALSYFNFSDSIMGVCASINGSNTEGITIDRTQFGICGACFFSIGYKGASTAAQGFNFYNGVIKKITYLNGAALDLKSLSTYQE